MGELLREEDDRQNISDQQSSVPLASARGRNVGAGWRASAWPASCSSGPIGVEPNSPDADGSAREKSGVQAETDQREKGVLVMGQGRTHCRLVKSEHDEGEYHQWNDHAEIGVGALKIVLLFAMAPGAEQQRQATMPLRIIITTASRVSRARLRCWRRVA